MSIVTEEVPVALQRAAEAALIWVNQERGTQFELTGLVDYDAALAGDASQPMEMGLVLCDGEICTREQVRVQVQGDGFTVGAVATDGAVIPPHLDPPPGLRKGWLDEQLARHAFVVILFYRGFW